jgi:hypothetical protein
MKFATHSRGQALFETAISMPLFLIGLFGVMWAMKEASMSARVQLAVRYGGMVAQLSQPYDSFSLYSLYATIDNHQPASATACFNGDASQLTTNYAPYWLPAPSPAPAPIVSPCASSIVLINAPEAYSQPIILRNDYSSIQASVPVSGFLSTAALHGVTATTIRGAQNFFRSPDVGTVLSCTELGAQIKLSLEGQTDTTTAPASAAAVSPSVVMTPMPTTVPANNVVPATMTSACASTTYATPANPY